MKDIKRPVCENCGGSQLTHFQISNRIVCLGCGQTQKHHRPGQTADKVGVVPGDRVWWRGNPRIPATPVSRKLAAPEVEGGEKMTVPLSECFADQGKAIEAGA